MVDKGNRRWGEVTVGYHGEARKRTKVNNTDYDREIYDTGISGQPYSAHKIMKAR